MRERNENGKNSANVLLVPLVYNGNALAQLSYLGECEFCLVLAGATAAATMGVRCR